jgi:16S rRNA (cytosine1402-N4)-methyltransferase
MIPAVGAEASGGPREHPSVLLQEVLAWLDLKPGLFVVDATVGPGGHARAMLERILPGGQLLALDRDPEALALAHQRLDPFGSAVEIVHSSFARLPLLLAERGRRGADRILLDLGLSLPQITSPRFSFHLDAPLDFRLDPALPYTAADYLARLSEKELARVLWELGEERWAGRIARAIVRQRQRAPITTTQQLVHLVESSVPRAHWPRRRHVATRTFQAFRLLVNQELEALDQFLEALPEVLLPGGRVAILSYHSLEDRRVKRAFRALAGLEGQTGPGVPPTASLILLTRRAVRPSAAEIAANPRARSARLRVAARPVEASTGSARSWEGPACSAGPANPEEGGLVSPALPPAIPGGWVQAGGGPCWR